mgnify:CR=1 FL=1
MKVVVLGCGGSAGVPNIGGADGAGDWGACDPDEPRNRRTRPSIVVESADGRRVLVDTSPDMRAQLLACRIPSVDAVLFTHAHADHIAGIDDVRILNRIADRPLDAVGTAETLEELARRYAYVFAPWTGPCFYRPVMTPRIVEFGQGHGRVDSIGFRIGPFAYSTDVVELDDAAFAALAGIDTWLVGCFLREGRHTTHANLDLALRWVERLRPRRTVLTHMGPGMDWAWMRANLPPGVEPAFDGMEMSFPET